MQNGPIFIVGMNGSGTTALLDHLDSHPVIFGFPEETRVIPYLIRQQNKYEPVSDLNNQRRLWQDICKSFPFWKVNGESPVPIPEDWADLSACAADIIDYVLTYFAKNANKSIWCEKTPMHALHVQELAKAFPGSRFIHIIRDGRDCAASFERRWSYNAEVTVFRWKNVIRAARKQSRTFSSDRYFEVRYERLTDSPEQVMREICDFLSVQFHDSMLISSRTTERVRGIASNKLRRNSRSYQRYFSSKRLEQIEDICGKLLHELDYETNNKNGDRDLNPAFVKFHQTKTQLGRIHDIFNRARAAKKPFRLIVARIKSGLEQRKTNKH